MPPPAWTLPRTWSVGDVLTQPRAQAYLADDFVTGPQAATVAALNTACGPNGPGIGARGLISFLDANGLHWAFPVVWEDASQGWRTQRYFACTHGATTADTGTTYAVTTRGVWIPFAGLKAAGLNLEMQVSAVLNAGASSSEYAAGLVSYAAQNGAVTDYLTNGTGEVFTANAGASLMMGDWALLGIGAITAIGTTEYVELSLGNKRVGANAGNIRAGSALHFRLTGAV